MSMSIVVDASLAVEVLLRTPLGIGVAAQLEQVTLLSPDLLDAEVLSVVRRLTLAGEISDVRAGVALDDLSTWPIERVPSRLLLAHAWGYRHNVSGYDALYVAVAKIRGAPLYTADGPLARAPALGIEIHNIQRSP